MNDRQNVTVESRFADRIWQVAPISTGDLVRLCEQEFRWKKSTTYTVLGRLCDKGLFINDKGTVRALVSREEYDARRSGRFVEEYFGGSLPAFVTAFAAGKRLSEEDVEQLRRIIDAYKEGQ